MIIIPAILPKTHDELIGKLQQLSDSGFSGRIQIDICDGKFVDSVTWPFDRDPANIPSSIQLMSLIKNDEELQSLLKNFTVDLDLMVQNAPESMMVWNMYHPDRIIIHIDSLKDTHSLTQLINEDGLYDVIHRKAFVFAFSIDTDIEQFAYWYDTFGMRSVQVMGIEKVGYQGQEFSELALDVLEKLQARYADLEIMVDGGVSISSIERLSQYGVTACVAGSAVFKNNDISRNLLELQGML
jgi:ribulose-phosphate 3-epimerase